MSAPSGPPLKVFVCPECGGQCGEMDMTQFAHGHWHHASGVHFVKAEEVEVIPVADFERLLEKLAIEAIHHRAAAIDDRKEGEKLADGVDAAAAAKCWARERIHNEAASRIEQLLAASEIPESTEGGL